MSRIGITVGGRRRVAPGVFAETNVDAFNIARQPIQKRPAILAEAEGGPPGEFITLYPDTAARSLRGGVGLELAELVFAPSSEVPGAGEILFYRLGNAERAELDMGDLTLRVRPTFAGNYGNGFRAKREQAPDGVARLLFVEDPAAGLLEESPPLGPALRLYYLGSDSPSAQITETDGQKHLILTGDGPVESHDIMLGGVGIQTFTELAIFLNGTSAWAAEVLYEHGSFNPSDLPTGTLTLAQDSVSIDDASNSTPIVIETSDEHTLTTGDHVTITDVGGNTAANGSWTVTVLSPTTFSLDGSEGSGSYTSGGTVLLRDINALLNLGPMAQVRWLEDASELAEAETTGAPDDFSGIGYVYFTGGGSGDVVTLADYDAALTKLEGQDIQTIAVGTTDEVVHAMVDAHCLEMSHPATARERRFFGGPRLRGTKGAQLQSAQNLAKELNSQVSSIVGVPIKRRNLRTGRMVDLPPNHAAAMLMGMACGVTPEVDLTYKTIRISGTTFELTDAEVAELIKAGVVPVHFDSEDNVFRISDDVTTWQQDINVMRRLRYGVSVRHYLTRRLRQVTKIYVGKTGNLVTIESIKNAIAAFLNSEISTVNPSGILTPGVDEQGNELEPWRDLQIIYESATTVVGVEFNANVVGRIGYIHHMANLQPVRIAL